MAFGRPLGRPAVFGGAPGRPAVFGGSPGVVIGRSSVVIRTPLQRKTEEVPVTETRPAAPRQGVYGRKRVSGVTVFAHQTTGRVPVVPGVSITAKISHLVMAFADHEIEAFDEVWFDDEVVPLDGDGQVTSGHELRGFAWVNKHLGSDAQGADSDLIAAAPDKWNSNDRLRGVAYLYVRLHLVKAKFPNARAPNITAVVKGKKLFDTRTSTTVWSANAALALRDYLTDTRYGLGVPAADIDDAAVNTAADVCDESVTLAAGGSESRYEANGEFSLSTAPREIIDGLKGAMADSCPWTGGKWVMTAGKYVAPTVSLGDDDLVAPPSVVARRPRTELYNRVRGVFAPPERNWRRTDLPPVTDATFVAQDAGEDIDRVMPFPFTTSFAAAQRLMKIALRRARQQEAVQLSAKPTALRLRAGDTVKVTNSRMGWTDKVFRVDRLGVGTVDAGGAPAIVVNLTCSAEGPSVYDWAAEEQALDPVPTVTLPVPFTGFGTPDRDDDPRKKRKFDLQVRGLEVVSAAFGGGLTRSGIATEFTGGSPLFRWRDNAQIESFELGAEPGGAGSGKLDPNFKDWEVTIWNLTITGFKDTVRRVDHMIFPEYEYSINKNRADGDGKPIREFIIEVRTRTFDGFISKHPASLKVKNPPPQGVLSFTLKSGDRQFTIGNVKATKTGTQPDPDQNQMVVWTSKTQGFTPDEETKVYQGAVASVVVYNLDPDTTYYVRTAIVDGFGFDQEADVFEELNVSSETSVKTGGDLNVTIPEGTTIVWDLDAITYAVVTLTGNATLDATNLRAGTFVFDVIQGNGNGNQLAYTPKFLFAGGVAPTLTTGNGAIDTLTFVCNGTVLRGVAQLDFKVT